MSEQPVPPVLAEGYYLDNFWRILESVESLYGDLLNQEELQFLLDFRTLPLDAQRLYVRLLSREGECFRRDRIAYTEIADIDATMCTLREKGFLGHEEELPLEVLLGRCVRGELEALGRALWKRAEGREGAEPRWRTLRKGEFIEVLCNEFEPTLLRLEAMSQVPVVRLLRWECCEVFRLLFFGSLRYDLTDFVLQDLGIVVYESYPILRIHRLFPSRKAIDEKRKLVHLREWIDGYLEAGDVQAAMEHAKSLLPQGEATGSMEYESVNLELSALGTPERDTWRLHWEPSSWRDLDKIFLQMGQALERMGDTEGALAFYRRAERPPARERCARIWERLGEDALALSMCEAMREGPRDETEPTMAERISTRIRRKLGHTLPKSKRTKHTKLELCLPADTASVEQDVLAHFEAQGVDGFHLENSLWLGLFGLLCWDILFAPLPGAFHHPFQRGPLDLEKPEFYPKRASLFAARWDEATVGNGPQRIYETYQAKVGIANAFVAWELLPWERLEAILGVLPASHLVAVCRRLCRDVRRYRRGLPDLFVFQGAQGYTLFEVKGPGDQMRPEQTAWLDYFVEVGMPAAILHIKRP